MRRTPSHIFAILFATSTLAAACSDGSPGQAAGAPTTTPDAGTNETAHSEAGTGAADSGAGASDSGAAVPSGSDFKNVKLSHEKTKEIDFANCLRDLLRTKYAAPLDSFGEASPPGIGFIEYSPVSESTAWWTAWSHNQVIMFWGQLEAVGAGVSKWRRYFHMKFRSTSANGWKAYADPIFGPNPHTDIPITFFDTETMSSTADLLVYDINSGLPEHYDSFKPDVLDLTPCEPYFH